MRTMTRRRFTTLTLASAAGIAGLPFIRPANAEPTREEVFGDPVQPAFGNPEGDVTIVEYFDYQCPFCKANHPILKQLVADDGKIRLLMKDWPIFGDPSLHAARLVLGAIGTPVYATGHDALMATKGRLSIEDVEKILSDAGLDPKSMLEGYRKQSDVVDALIGRNSEQAEGLGLSGTPGFVIGSRVYSGMLDRKALEQAVSEARAEAGATPR